MEQDQQNPSVVEELKRRKVFQTAAAYIVGSWVVIQAADLLLPVFEAPFWAFKTIVTLLVIGFPPTMALTWLFDVTRHGPEHAPDFDPGARSIFSAPWFRGIVVFFTLMATGTAVWFVWADYQEGAANWVSVEDDRTNTPVVAIAPIRNLTGDPDNDWLGEGLANLVRVKLAQSRFLVIVSDTRWDAIGRQAGENGNVKEIAARAGIGYVLSAEYLAQPGGLVLTIRLEDLGGGADRVALSISDLTPEGMLGSADRIAILAKQGLKLPHTDRVASFAGDSPVDNMAAYEAYIGGLEYFRNFEFEQAEKAMTLALELAPGFHIARYRLAHIKGATGRREQALETIDQIPDDAKVSERESLYIDAARKLFAHDFAAAIASYHALLDQYPYEVEARQYLAEAYFQDYQDDAAIGQLRILGEQEPENEFVWSAMGTFLLLTGRLELAEEPLNRYLKIAADKTHPHTLLGDLYRQRAEYDQAIERYQAALAITPDFTEAQRGLAQVYAVTGQIDAAKEIWVVIVSDESIEPDERIYAAFDLNSILRSEGRFEEALEPLIELEAEIKAEQVRYPLSLSTRALSQIELGNYERAAELIDLAIYHDQNPPTDYPPTRFLFVRGLLQYEQGDLDGLATTIGEVQALSPSPEEPNRREDKAAAYLEGLKALASGDLENSVGRMIVAVETEGYAYSMYELGLAMALERAGRLDEALHHAENAAVYRDPGDVRLDMEIDRVRALQLQAQILDAMGEQEKAQARRNQYLARWTKNGEQQTN